MKALLSISLLIAALCLATPIAAAEKSWADGVPYTTNWDEAIRQARESGRSSSSSERTVSVPAREI